MLTLHRMALYFWLLFTCSFAVAVVHLFQLRYTTGDVYPAYSSLRSDPLGAKAFYESLRRLPQLEVRRNLKPVGELDDNHPVTGLFLGLTEWTSYDPQVVREWEKLAIRGGRVILSFAPVSSNPREPRLRAASSSESAKPQPERNNPRQPEVVPDPKQQRRENRAPTPP